MKKKGLSFTPDEIALFAFYKTERLKGPYDLLGQKRGAEKALEYYRPKLFVIVYLTQAGFDNAQIARALGLSEATIVNHKAQIFQWMEQALID